MPTATEKKDEAKLQISQEEAEKGIYIKFEGIDGDRPALLGMRCEDEFDQAVLDRKMDQGARAEGVSISTFSLKVRKLIEQADEEGRTIFSFGDHTMDMVAEHSDYADELEPLHRDLQDITKAWYKETHPDEKALKGWKLEAFLDFLGYSKPAWAGRTRASKRIRDVRKQFLKKDEYSDLTSTARSKWQKMLRYNRRQVAGLQFLARTVAGLDIPEELEEYLK